MYIETADRNEDIIDIVVNLYLVTIIQRPLPTNWPLGAAAKISFTWKQRDNM